MGVDVDLATCTNSSFLCLGQRREVQKTALEDMGSDIPLGKEKIHWMMKCWTIKIKLWWRGRV